MASGSYKALEGQVAIFLLDPDGLSVLVERGWRGRELFVGSWEDTPAAIAKDIGEELKASVEVHAVIKSDGRTWVVLRMV